MRAFLSSYGFGNFSDELLKLTTGRRCVIIGNAGDHKTVEDRAEKMRIEHEQLDAVGFESIELDLRDYFEDQSGLEEILRNCDLLWVRGGNSFNLIKALVKTGADKIIKKLLEEDSIVYGGYSAGAVIMQNDLHGVEFVDDPYDIPELYDHEIVWSALGLLPYYVVPHYQSEHVESELVEKTAEFYVENDIPFRPLRDGEVIVINGDSHRTFELPTDDLSN